MNLFGFGGKKKQSAPQQAAPQEAIALLDTKIEILYKRESFLTTKVEQCKKEALALKKRGNKTGAMIALKKSNRYQEEIKKLQGTVMNLEEQKIMLESAKVNVEVMKAIKTSNQELEKIHEDVNPEKVEEIMEEVEDQKDISNQISEALSRNTEDMFEDEDLLAELDGLEDELEMMEETEKAPAIPTKPQAQQQQTPPEAVFNFPNAPQGQLQPPQQQAVQETEDERAIRELQESMLV